MNLLLSRKLTSEEKLPKTSFLMSNMFKVSIPAALETFLVGLVGLIDTIMVGKVGEEAIAAISIAQQPIFISLAACVGLNVGVISIIARRYGEKDKIEANKSLRNALIIGFLISIVMTIFSIILAKPLMILAGAEDDTVEKASRYFQIVSLALILNYLRLIICSALRATGKTNITLITNIIANVLNVLFNYLLIEGNFSMPRLEVYGAAIATVIGNTAAFIVSFIAIYKSKGFLSIRFFDDWHLYKDKTKQLFSVSYGAFIDQLFVRIGFFITGMIVNNLGTQAVAVNAIANSVIALSFNITDGFSVGCSALVGKSLGEKRSDVAYAYGRLSQITSLLTGIVIVSLIIKFRYNLSSLFSDKTELIEKASDLLKFAAFIIIPQSLQWVTNGVLKGAGDTKFTARVSLISILIIRPLASYICCYTLHFGVTGAWLGMLFQQGVRLLLNLGRFENLKWVKIKV